MTDSVFPGAYGQSNCEEKNEAKGFNPKKGNPQKCGVWDVFLYYERENTGNFGQEEASESFYFFFCNFPLDLPIGVLYL